MCSCAVNVVVQFAFSSVIIYKTGITSTVTVNIVCQFNQSHLLQQQQQQLVCVPLC